MSYRVMKFLLQSLLQTGFVSCIYIWLCWVPLLTDFCLALWSSQPLPCHPFLHDFSFWSALTLLACLLLCSVDFLRRNPEIFTWFPRLFPLFLPVLLSASELSVRVDVPLLFHLLTSSPEPWNSISILYFDHSTCMSCWHFQLNICRTKLTLSLPNQLLLQIFLLPFMASVAQSSSSLAPTFNQLLLWWLFCLFSLSYPLRPHTSSEPL